MTEFSNVTFPPKDSKEHFHDCNFFSILVSRGCQSEVESFLQVRGTPRYVIGRDVSWQPSWMDKELARVGERLRGTTAL